MSSKGLGRGLSALLGEEAVNKDAHGVNQLKISEIESNPYQPRKFFQDQAIEELKDSILKNGIITPITVRKLSSGYYQIVAGERRWRAARLAGLTEIPAVIVEADDRRAFEVALIENLQREDLNPIEEASGYKTLMEEYGLTQEEVAEQVGKSRPAVTNAMRLLKLPAAVMDMVAEGILSSGHARTLLPLGDEKKILDAACKIKKEGLSVRQAENLVKKLLNSTEEQKPAEKEIAVDYLADLERSLSSNLGRKIKITAGKEKGRIELEFYGNDDLDRLINSLLGMRR